VLLSEQEWPSATSGVGRRRQRQAITTCVSDVRKKATLGGNQRRRVLRHETHPIGVLAKKMHPISIRLQYEIISNGLYSRYQYRSDQ
jgi:hypothetical protein